MVVFSGGNIQDYDYKVPDKFDASDFISIKMTSKATVLNEGCGYKS
ncbi:hypothetical protein [Flavobacterium sp. 14A]|nr:hypothetical protein [Flavobacterium sp. 14A]NRT11829.1 hypothetical protein [Flavobacterium sp. 14A]